jgi:hypothetical protein
VTDEELDEHYDRNSVNLRYLKPEKPKYQATSRPNTIIDLETASNQEIKASCLSD